LRATERFVRQKWGNNATVAIERLIVCPCQHDIEQHDERGCLIRTASGRCGCRRHRDAVLETLLSLEREDIRRQWLPREPH
jgi:hypothetical protein